jgi:quercetin dioxygenase-like cupin family protein
MKNPTLILVALVSCCVLSSELMAAESAEPEMQFEILTKSSTGWDGQPFSYPDGTAELTMARLWLPKGHVLPMHCHPVPVIGYILKGTLEVSKPSGETTRYLEKHGSIEVFQDWHEGMALEDSEFIVVYAGSQGRPLTITKEDGIEGDSACR